jgi:hypothetical protein
VRGGDGGGGECLSRGIGKGIYTDGRRFLGVKW